MSASVPIPAQTLAAFLADLRARTPSPGGGAVASLAGALGAAQLHMIAEYATWEAGNADPRPRLAALSEELLALAAEDAEAYGAYAAARAKRKEEPAAYARAQERIADVPARVLERCLEALRFVPAVLPRAPRWFGGDAAIASSCLTTGAQGARALAGSNLASLAGPARDALAVRLAAADRAAAQARNAIEPLLLARLAGS